MMGMASNVSDVLQNNSKTLLPYYEIKCGDRASFFNVDGKYAEFLYTRALESVSQSNYDEAIPYMRVAQNVATKDEVNRTFMEFMGDGRGCHETAPIWEVTRFTNSIQWAADPINPIIAQRTSLTPHPAKLYKEWQLFMVRYVELAGEIYTAVNGILNAPQADENAREKIWEMTNSTEFLVDRVSSVISEFTRNAASTELKIIKIQQAMLNNMRTSLRLLLHVSMPNSQENEYFGETLAQFKSTFQTISDPFYWMDAVVLRYPNEATRNIKIEVANKQRGLKVKDAPTVWAIMDWLIILADRIGTETRPVTLTIGTSPDMKFMVVSLPVLNTYFWPYIDRLLIKAGGTRQAGTEKTEILIPLEEQTPSSGPGPDGPPPMSNIDGESDATAPPFEASSDMTQVPAIMDGFAPLFGTMRPVPVSSIVGG